MRNLGIYALALAAALGAAPARAGSAVATPGLDPPSGGTVRCFVSNASATQTIEVEWGLYGWLGDPEWGPTTTELVPRQNLQSGSNVDAQATCIARVLSGSKANLRVSLVALDSNGNVRAAVEGR